MSKFCIFANDIENIADIRNYLRLYSHKNSVILKDKIYYDANIIAQDYNVDVCLVNFKVYVEHKSILDDWQINTGIKFIFATSNIKEIIEIIEEYPDEYCALTPVAEYGLFKILDNIKSKIKQRSVVVKLSHQREKRLDIENLNYINITNRNLQYHLADNSKLNSQTLRQSFQKEIAPLLVNPELYFIPPSLLVNLNNINQLYNDHLEFFNEEKLFFPKAAHDGLHNAWKNYLA